MEKVEKWKTGRTAQNHKLKWLQKEICAPTAHRTCDLPQTIHSQEKCKKCPIYIYMYRDTHIYTKECCHNSKNATNRKWKNSTNKTAAADVIFSQGSWSFGLKLPICNEITSDTEHAEHKWNKRSQNEHTKGEKVTWEHKRTSWNQMFKVKTSVLAFPLHISVLQS